MVSAPIWPVDSQPTGLQQTPAHWHTRAGPDGTAASLWDHEWQEGGREGVSPLTGQIL